MIPGLSNMPTRKTGDGPKHKVDDPKQSAKFVQTALELDATSESDFKRGMDLVLPTTTQGTKASKGTRKSRLP